jgi:signal transduction histidine kinase
LSDARHQLAARQITEQSHRISQIITDLMDFAKPVPPKVASADVADIVERAMHDAKMHADQVDRAIEVTMGEVPRVLVDPEQVSAAIAEVIDNALHATEQNKGQISVHAAFDQYSSRVVVTVTDAGAGMDEATAKRAFDPFFSAKAAGRRRGMGLAKALRWVEASGGSMRLESRQGQGTRMLVLLPAEKSLEQESQSKGRKAAQ